MPSGVYVPSRWTDLAGDVHADTGTVAQGGVPYKGADGKWHGLAPVASGRVLTDGGPGGNPSWQVPASGVTDHGALTGLGDDDHTIYALADRSRPSPWVSAADLSGLSLADLGTRAHSALTGLTAGDDHAQYLFNAPAGADRNVIAPTGDFSAVRARRNSSGQTNPIEAWETEGGTALASVSAAGFFGIGRAPSSTAALSLTSAHTSSTASLFEISASDVDTDTNYLRLTSNTSAAAWVPSFFARSTNTNGRLAFIYDTAGSWTSNPTVPAIEFQVRNGGVAQTSTNRPAFGFHNFSTQLTSVSVDGAWTYLARTATTTPQIIRGAISQTAPLLQMQLISSTPVAREVLNIEPSWATSTDASRKARVVFGIYDTAVREAMRLEASGSAAMIGFLGAAAVVRQTLGAAATDAATTQTLANNIRTALINLGLGVT